MKNLGYKEIINFKSQGVTFLTFLTDLCKSENKIFNDYCCYNQCCYHSIFYIIMGIPTSEFYTCTCLEK